MYYLSATHRGDMYAIRAAMTLLPGPLFIYDSSDKTQDLETYLCRTAWNLGQDYFTVPWNYTEYSAPGAINYPSKIANCTLGIGNGTDGNGYKSAPLGHEYQHMLLYRKDFKLRSEANASRAFATGISDGNFKKIKESMALFPNRSVEAKIKEMLQPIVVSLFGKPTAQNTVLVVHRDSGAVGGATPGAYPELDTGHALEQILEVVSSTASSSGGPLRPVMCGSVASTSKAYSIGEYWLQLSSVRAAYKDDPNVTKRDIEALFLLTAYEMNCFQLVVGFRSGAVDLFTLMGIPSVSIGLRYLVGEDRHDYLAQSIFRRVNVKYDLPRHKATAWIRSKHAAFGSHVNVLYSPYWAMTGDPNGVNPKDLRPMPSTVFTQELQDKARAELPGPFGGFDNWVFEVGLNIACEKFIHGWGHTTERITPEANDFIINTAYARYCYPAALSKQMDKLPAHFKELQELELIDLGSHQKMVIELQEGSIQRYSVMGYKLEADEMWGRLKPIMKELS
jgi:hypothetical protein